VLQSDVTPVRRPYIIEKKTLTEIEMKNRDLLISLNFNLQQPEAANGLLKIMHKSNHPLREDWYLKLHEWSLALNIYEEKGDELSMDDILGKIQ
jgi:hypothetical protein